MPRKRKQMGTGATIKVIKRFIHPSEFIRERFKNPKKGEKLEDCLVIGRGEKVVRRKQQMCIIFRHGSFENVELYAVERYCSITKEGPESEFFTDEIDEMIEETFVEDAMLTEETKEDEESEKIDAHRHGGELELLDLAMAGFVVENDNDPLFENAPESNPSSNEKEEVTWGEWGHSGICYRKQSTATTIMPAIKIQNKKTETMTRLQLFELFFITDYIKEVILVHINKNINGETVTYGEFLRWLGIWLLIASVVGPKRDAFFLNKPCDEFSEAPFRVSHYMSRRRFDKILHAIRFHKTAAPDYRDRFWEVRELIDAWNYNMQKIFQPGWVSCLDESMSPWTNKYTCPGHMVVPRKPWPLGNEYHTICCCTSGVMYAAELVEGKDRPKEKPAEKFSSVVKNGTTTSLLLRLCESIFHIGMVVILDSGFCVLRALIELKKRGVFASALIKKRRYWPKHIKGDDIIKHFEKHKVGDTESLPGTLDGVPFHVFAMKEPDYTMKIMSTYGTNERNENHRTRRVYKDENNKLVSTSFNYPEVISNHFKFRHAVDDHNGRRHSPICLEHVWATKYWPHRPFSFLLAVTEVNVNLAEAYFVTHNDPKPQIEYRKLLAQDLIHNEYIVQEQVQQQTRRSKRKAALEVHCLRTLRPYKKFSGTKIIRAKSKYPQATCTMGHRKVRTYCACSPGVLRCDQCYAFHCIEVEYESAKAD